MTTTADWTHPADETILRYFAEHPPEYVPLVANRLGMHLGYVEGRVERLVREGFLVAITGEVVYAITDEGERYLRAAAGNARDVDADVGTGD